MKTFYLLVFLFSFGLIDEVRDELVDNNYSDDDTYVGNPDDFEIIERPCQVYDIHCIRKFFASHAKCTVAEGPLPDTRFRSQDTFYISRANITVTVTNLMIQGLRTTRVEEFYINKATNKVVFAINIESLNQTSNNIYIRFRRRGREPVVGVTSGFIFYRSVTFTAIIPNINNLQLDKAEITAYSDTAIPPFAVSPVALANGDPETLGQFALFAMPETLPINVQEIMLTESQFYPPFYIQTNICDFGLKIPE